MAVGYASHPEGAIAALRAGVSDFIDLSGEVEGMVEVVQHLLAFPGDAAGEGGTQRSVLLLGARAGVGASTLAVHAAACAQQRLARWHAMRVRPEGRAARQGGEAGLLPMAERVSVLDLGYPVGDCLLYFGLSSDFDFAEGVRNIARLDGTLLNSAMAHRRPAST